VGPVAGTRTALRAFWNPNLARETLFGSAGVVMIGIGIVGLLGVFDRSARLAKIAGVLAIVGFALLLISLMRGTGSVSDIKAGPWLLLAGGVALVASETPWMRRERPRT
jgi:hypothetical protein